MRKCIVSRDVVFNEGEMGNLVGKDRVNSDMKNGGSSVSSKLQLEVEPKELVLHNAKEVGKQTGWSEHEAETSSDQTDLSGYNLKRDREIRVVKAPSRYGYADFMAYAFVVAEVVNADEPRNYSEAVKGNEKSQWLTAMKEHIQSLYKNKTWRLVDRPKNQKVVGCKWVFKRKQEAVENGKLRFKARLVAQGFAQREGVDFNEIFSLVVKHRLIRLVLSLIAQFDLELEQMDVKTAFLYGDLEETIYMRQQEGFEVKGKEDQVCLLQRSLYGLK